jgi:hypothetical protein
MLKTDGDQRSNKTMRLRSSFWAMLGRDVSPTSDKTLEEIRTAMLDTLGNHSGPGQLRIETEITLAIDLAELWHLRPRLLQAISTIAGDAVAERELRDITARFEGQYPVAG